MILDLHRSKNMLSVGPSTKCPNLHTARDLQSSPKAVTTSHECRACARQNHLLSSPRYSARSGARWFVDQRESPPRDNADGKHRVLKPTVKTSPSRKHCSHLERSENSPFTHDRSNNKIHLLPKTRGGGCSINHDKSKGWDSWAKSSLIAQTTMRNPQAPQRPPCFPAGHPRHHVSQTAHGPAIPTTSAALEPPQQTPHALKATGLTSKLRPMALSWKPLRASPICCWCSARLR